MDPAVPTMQENHRRNQPSGLFSVVYNCYVAAMVARAAEIARGRGGWLGPLPMAEQKRSFSFEFLLFPNPRTGYI